MNKRLEPTRFSQPHGPLNVYRDDKPFTTIQRSGSARLSEVTALDIDVFARCAGAAPDLLRSCKALERFASGFEDCELQEGMAELLADARAAIAKAEGRDGAA